MSVIVAKYTQEQALQIIENLGYKIEDEYLGYSKRTSFSDSEGYWYYVSPKTIIDRTPPKFMLQNIHSLKNVKLFLDKINYPHELLSTEYQGSGKNSKLKFLCSKHGEFEISWNTVYSNHAGCRLCGNDTIKEKNSYTLEEYIEIAKEKGYEYVSGEYDGSGSNSITIKDSDGYLYNPSIRSLLRDKVPFPVTNFNNHSIHNIKLYMKKNKMNYELLSTEYKYGTKLILKCEKHGEFELSWSNGILQGYGCPSCSGSKYELKTIEFLTSSKIEFQTQKRFKDCKGDKSCLPFDVFIPSMNMCIEVDGKQHYVSLPHFEKTISFEKRQQYDQIKNQYCIDNDILLLRLPYTEFENGNVDNILNQVIINENYDNEFIINQIIK